MAKKMTLSGYLAQRGTKAKALTRGEAALLGIPYPLQAGWPRRYGAREIGDELLEQLMTCVAVTRAAAEEKAKRAKASRTSTPAAAQLEPQATMAPAAVKVIAGFVLRKARRYRARRLVPWS